MKSSPTKLSIPIKINKPYPAVLIFGPTAVGKTELLESILPGSIEVINTDSMQIYRGMDIGSAKPDPGFLEKVPHHLIDILTPDQLFSAGDFVNRADSLVKSIYEKGKLPVLCGGTAFYFKNFIYGLPETPEVSRTIREEINRDLDTKGLKILYRELEAKDPAYAATIPDTQKSRILRALEVIRSTGRPLSSFKEPAVPRKAYRFLSIALTRDRSELYSRINQRVELMFDQGLEAEMESLLVQGYVQDDPGMRGIGYREFFLCKSRGCLCRQELKEMIKQNSRRYAKRQITFFSSIQETENFSPENQKEIVETIKRFWEVNA